MYFNATSPTQNPTTLFNVLFLKNIEFSFLNSLFLGGGVSVKLARFGNNFGIFSGMGTGPDTFGQCNK